MNSIRDWIAGIFSILVTAIVISLLATWYVPYFDAAFYWSVLGVFGLLIIVCRIGLLMLDIVIDRIQWRAAQSENLRAGTEKPQAARRQDP